MRLIQMMIGSFVTLAGGLLAGAGAKKALQIPTLAIRRMLVLAIGAVASLVVLLSGLSMLISGLGQLSALYQEPWIFSLIAGGIIGLFGIVGLNLALRRESWVQPIPEPPTQHHPLVDVLLRLAVDALEQKLGPKRPQDPVSHPTHHAHHPESSQNPNQWTVN